MSDSPPPVDQATARFYSEMYAEGREAPPPSGLLGRLFLRLRRFELHRIPATARLLEPGERLLDLGCGDGSLLAEARTAGFKEVHGLDIAANVVEGARRTCARRLGDLSGVHVQQADLNASLPYPDGFFDAVTAIAVIEHIFDPYFTLREMRRVLRPGGYIILEVPNLVWLPRRLDVFLGRLPVTADEAGWDGGHLHYFTFPAVHKLLVDEGFAVVTMESTGIFPRVRNLWPSMLGGNILAKARRRRDGA